jgi:hypothetical protein
MAHEPIQLNVSSDDGIAYVLLPDHPRHTVPRIVKKQIRLSDVVDGYKGPDIYLDFNTNDVLIGIEIT